MWRSLPHVYIAVITTATAIAVGVSESERGRRVFGLDGGDGGELAGKWSQEFRVFD